MRVPLICWFSLVAACHNTSKSSSTSLEERREEGETRRSVSEVRADRVTFQDTKEKENNTNV